MALTIEDGTGVPGANSYNSLPEIRSFASARGLDLPAADADLEILAIQAFDYIESFRTRFQGMKTTVSLRHQWPRSGVVVDGYYVPSDVIPAELKDAHAQATVEAYSTDLMSNPTAAVKKEKVDVLEVEYQESSPVSMSPSFPKVDAFLAPLLSSGGGWRPSVVRG